LIVDPAPEEYDTTSIDLRLDRVEEARVWDVKAFERALVYRQERAIVVRPGGFFLWQTRERVGTPPESPRLISFVNSRSTVARVGVMGHMTAPTIHAGWVGKVTLEIANLGPFNLILHEFDAVVQLTVAIISSPPLQRKKTSGIDINQRHVSGHAEPPPPAS
jgi:dCTP deaminase